MTLKELLERGCTVTFDYFPVPKKYRVTVINHNVGDWVGIGYESTQNKALKAAHEEWKAQTKRHIGGTT